MNDFVLPGGARVSFKAVRGELILLRGPNGCGKTTLLRHLAGLPHAGEALNPESGDSVSRSRHASDPAARTNRASAPRSSSAPGAILVTQDPRDGLIGLTVAGEFRLRRLCGPEPPVDADPNLGPRTSNQGGSAPSNLGGAALLKKSLAFLAERDVATLSSGEARKVGLGVAHASLKHSGKNILLLDEPAEGLDDDGKVSLLALVAAAQESGCVVAVDHTGTLAAQATRTVELAPEPAAHFPEIPTNDRPPRLESAATRVSRGEETLDLPAVRLGSGFHVLVGPNGAGKSTLLLQLAGLLGKTPGASVNGEPARPGDSIRLLLPRARDLFLHRSVRDEIASVTAPWLDLILPTLLDRHPLTLSGGEAQRVALVKTFGRPAAAYLLDEPDAHLDGVGWNALWQLVAARVAEGACVLAATHDARLIARAHSVVRLEARP